jgi:hypothetical protein
VFGCSCLHNTYTYADIIVCVCYADYWCLHFTKYHYYPHSCANSIHPNRSVLVHTTNMSCAHLLLLLLLCATSGTHGQHEADHKTIQSIDREPTQISEHKQQNIVTHYAVKSKSSNSSGGHDNGSEPCTGCDCDHGTTSSMGVTIASWNYCEVRQPLMLSAFILALIILLLCKWVVGRKTTLPPFQAGIMQTFSANTFPNRVRSFFLAVPSADSYGCMKSRKLRLIVYK